jgi:RNA polymerase sigma-70 factor (ECF subfamily)
VKHGTAPYSPETAFPSALRSGLVSWTNGDSSRPNLDEETDALRRARLGDRDSFARLVEQYFDRLYRWLYRLTHNQHAAEDLAQETFLKAFAHLATFRLGSNFQAWLYRIAYNTFLNQRRSASRMTRQPFPESLPAGSESPDEEAVSHESLQLLARAVARLPNEFRAAFLLRVEEGLSFREIADILETTEQTARWRVYKARQKLLNVLAPQLDQDKP